MKRNEYQQPHLCRASDSTANPGAADKRKFTRRFPLFQAILVVVVALCLCLGADAKADGVANDNFANAQQITGLSGTANGTTVNATKEANEPDHAGNSGGHSIWYTWTPAVSQSYSVDTFTSNFDTLLAIYTGTSVDTLTQIVSNDDAGEDTQASLVSFQATAGTVYYIAVDGYGGGSGTVALHWGAEPILTSAVNAVGVIGDSFGYQITATDNPTSYSGDGLPPGLSVDPETGLLSGTPTETGTFTSTPEAANTSGTGSVDVTITIYAARPANDDFVNAQVLTGVSGTASGFTTPATKEQGEPNHTGNTGGRSIWYSWTPSVSGTYSFDTFTSDFDTLLAVYTGTSVDSLTEVVSNDNAPGDHQATSRVVFGATKGTVYRIAVDGIGYFSGIGNVYTVSSGDVALHWAAVLGGEPPIITNYLNAAGVLGDSFSYQITASSSPTSYFANGLPGGLSPDAGTGLISGVPSQSGTFSVVLGAINDSGTGMATLTLRISATETGLTEPTVTSALTETGTVGLAISYQITAINNATGYGETGLPPGLSLNTATGLISGTSTVPGTYPVTITASNLAGQGGALLSLTVSLQPTVIEHFDVGGNASADLLTVNKHGATGIAILNRGKLRGNVAGPVIPRTDKLLGVAAFASEPTLTWVIENNASGRIEFWTTKPDNRTISAVIAGPVIPPGTQTGGMADFDGDGNPDILFVDPATGKTTIYFLDGFTAASEMPGPTLPKGHAFIALKDFSGQGNPDILTYDARSHSIKILIVNGMNLVSAVNGPQLTAGWELIGADDYIGNSGVDLLVYNPTTHQTQFWELKHFHKGKVIEGPTIRIGADPVETH